MQSQMELEIAVQRLQIAQEKIAEAVRLVEAAKLEYERQLVIVKEWDAQHPDADQDAIRRARRPLVR